MISEAEDTIVNSMIEVGKSSGSCDSPRPFNDFIEQEVLERTSETRKEEEQVCASK
tara:strand:+ start:592 stop:759 length:168 start_codon:yes stop_codon:yes gene_type:complete